MSSERLIWLGQKQEKELEAKRLDTSIAGLLSAIRVELNPHMPPDQLNQDLVFQQAFDLADKVTRYKGLLAEIENINKSLGLA